MKLRNLLCIAALAAVVALTGVSAGSAAAVAQAAEETRIAGLDEVLKYMYNLYLAGNYEEMYAVDTSDAVSAYADMVRASGADRYILDLDGNTKAMMYVNAGGGYWWYFGQMQGSLRHGQGATVLLGSGGYDIFTGSYSNDFPSGEGKLTGISTTTGASYEVTGNFQGVHMNGAYQVKVNWLLDGEIPQASELTVGYTNSAITSVLGWDVNVYPYEYEVDYEYTNPVTGESTYFYLDAGMAMYVIGLNENGSWGWWDYVADGLSIFYGDANALATVQASTTPIVTEPAVITVPVFPTITIAAPSTYTVVRDDCLYKIAQKVYEDGNKWKTIYEANKHLINNDSYIIYANQVFTIPAL